jgi:tripartite-type tricarboxylate transporter receptor subunit TctC
MNSLVRITWPILFFVLALGSAIAQPYPNKAIRIIVPFGPGGATDLISRAFGKYLQDHWNYPVVVENRPGANGLIGTEALKRANPDGYTLGMASNSTHAAAPHLFKRLSYKPIDDFEHIGLFGLAGSVALVSAGSPFKSIAEFVTYAKANPGKVFFGYANTSSQVPAELLKVRAALPIDSVQYKVMGQAMTDLIGGQIQFMFADYLTASGQIRSGRLIPIAVTESQRCALWPNVPTIAETYPGFELHGFVGLAAPHGTPKGTLLKVNQAMRDALADPSFRSFLVGIGMTPKTLTSEEYQAFLLGETDRWREYVKAAKIEPQ